MNTGQGLSRPWTTSWLSLRISESSRPSEAAHEPIGAVLGVPPATWKTGERAAMRYEELVGGLLLVKMLDD